MSVCRLLLLAFFNKEKAVSLLPALSLPFRLRASRIQAARALRTRLFLLLYVPPGHAPFGCSEDPPVLLARLLCCMGPQYGLNSKLPWGIFRGSFGGSTNGDRLSWFWVSCSVAHLVPGFLHRLSAQKHHPRLGNRRLVSPYHCSRPKKSRRLRMVVSMFSYYSVSLRVLAYERLVRSAGRRRGQGLAGGLRGTPFGAGQIGSRVDGPRHMPAEQGLNRSGL